MHDQMKKGGVGVYCVGGVTEAGEHVGLFLSCSSGGVGVWLAGRGLQDVACKTANRLHERTSPEHHQGGTSLWYRTEMLDLTAFNLLGSAVARKKENEAVCYAARNAWRKCPDAVLSRAEGVKETQMKELQEELPARLQHSLIRYEDGAWALLRSLSIPRQYRCPMHSQPSPPPPS